MNRKKVSVGSSALKLSQIVLGTWRLLDQQQSDPLSPTLKLLDHSLELGISSFDLADIYGDYRCEELFGQALKSRPSIRSEIQLISKAGIKLISSSRPEHRVKHYDTGVQHLTSSVESSLRHLGTEYLDLFLIHRPDPFMDYEESARALKSLVEQGKVLQVGVSNFLPQQVRALQAHLDIPLVCNQIEISCLHQEAFHDGSLDQCQELGIQAMAWSPLGGGAIFSSSGDTTYFEGAKCLKTMAEARGVEAAQLAIAWLLQHPAQIIPVIGTQKLERLQKLAQSVALEMDRQEWFEIYEAFNGKEVP